MTKQLSAVEQALQDNNAEGFRLTDDIIIRTPSRRQAELIQATDDPEKIMEIVLGEHFEAAKEVLENLPMNVEIRVMEEMLKHLVADVPTVDDVISRLGIEGADAASIAQKAVANAAK